MESIREHALRRSLVEYDAIRRRLWIFGQRCHHGATGALVAGAAVLIPPRRPKLALALTGATLMAHDWNDRSIWFERGHGTQT
jgi:hypothetical protein